MPRPPRIYQRNFSAHVKVDPQKNQVVWLIQQALALHQQGKFNEAQVIYRRVLVIQPDYFDALQLMGALFLQTKQFIKAVEFLTKALRVNPHYAEAYSNLGVALMELNRLDEALINYEKAIRIKPDYAEAYFSRGNALQELKRFDVAIVSYEMADGLKSAINWLSGDLLQLKMKIFILVL